MYNKEIDEKWRKEWEKNNIYKYEEKEGQKKIYQLEMFSYPSGAKLHLGHWYNYAPMDTFARYKKMNGYNVFHPMGFDAFGLPAENYAIKTGVHPAISTKQNIENMEEQLKQMGASYDWNYEIQTCSPSYYKWTQWLFSELYKSGRAYRKQAPVNFCPSCNTVLANEQVIDGLCERCDTPVERRKLKQWFFKTTEYAEELLEKLDDLDWPDLTKKIQKNWIGKSIGAEIVFKVDGLDKSLTVFTTRPDTIYGVEYLSMAPDIDDVYMYVTDERKEEVKEYIYKTSLISEIDRQSTQREKTGTFTGMYAINPVNNKKVPIYLADYVLASYGSGVVMGVPAHDERDFNFAKKYNINMTQVITDKSNEFIVKDEAFVDTSDNTMLINSDILNGLNVKEAQKRIIEYLEEKNMGNKKVQYRLKDWLVSRQRYWGAPIPIVYCPKCGEVLAHDLPVLLPDNVEFEPTGESPLAKCESFINTVCPKCGEKAKREVDTLDTFVCSSWYYLRYPFNKNEDMPFDKAKVNDILPVDIYVGGKEHAAMHLIYARYITKALRDLGYLKFDEPFLRLVHQGLILGPDGNKMSKSKGNTIAPDDYVAKYGADVLRMYLMFAFSYTEGGAWDENGIKAMSKYFQRVETLFNQVQEIQIKEDGEKELNPEIEGKIKDLEYTLNRVIKAVGEDIEKIEFNTAVARLMELTNDMAKFVKNIKTKKEEQVLNEVFNKFLIILSVFAPHFSQEMYSKMGNTSFIYNEKWPQYDEKKLVQDTMKLAVQINGKLRQVMEIDKDKNEEEIAEIVKQDEKIKGYIEGKTVVKEIYVKEKIYNIVVK